MMRALAVLGNGEQGSVVQADAQSAKLPDRAVLSTDPPYYDNVGYSPAKRPPIEPGGFSLTA